MLCTRPMTARSQTAVILLVLAACSARQGRPQVKPEAGAQPYRAEVLRLEGDFRGLSGLAVDGAGTLWAAPERQRRLVSLLVEPGAVRVGAVLPIEGVAPHLETESLAWLGPGTFALGCEASVPREEEQIVIVKKHADRVVAQETIPVPYSQWGIEGEENKGIEGLCHVHDELVLANENVIEDGGARFAPVARYGLRSKKWTPYRVRLTSESGKLAALECVGHRQDTLELLAIERHYAVKRIVRFELPRPAPDSGVTEVAATLHVDLEPLGFGDINPEGLVQRADGSLLLLGDNDHGGARDPTPVVVLSPL